MKNILIVEDDIHIGNAVEEALVSEGYGVSRAYSGTEAVLFLTGPCAGPVSLPSNPVPEESDRQKLMPSHMAPPDLMLLDLMLPGQGGPGY